jgi:hypothetical protein
VKKKNPRKLEVHRETLLLLLERKHLAIAEGADVTGMDTGSGGGECHSRICPG